MCKRDLNRMFVHQKHFGCFSSWASALIACSRHTWPTVMLHGQHGIWMEGLAQGSSSSVLGPWPERQSGLTIRLVVKGGKDSWVHTKHRRCVQHRQVANQTQTLRIGCRDPPFPHTKDETCSLDAIHGQYFLMLPLDALTRVIRTFSDQGLA